MLGGGAFGASVTSASFSGGANTVVVGGTLYAKQGAQVKFHAHHQQRHEVRRSHRGARSDSGCVGREDKLDLQLPGRGR
jgi:hypothetical protein